MQGPGRHNLQFCETKLMRQFNFRSCVDVKPAASLRLRHGTVMQPWFVRQESAHRRSRAMRVSAVSLDTRTRAGQTRIEYGAAGMKEV